MRFRDKVVWITGGGTGIGFSLAQVFGEEGAKVAISGRRQDRLDDAVSALQQLKIDAIAIRCDVTDESQVERAVADVVAHFGELDVAVANAGFALSGSVESLTADDWRRQFDVNVVGLALTAKYALAELRKTKGRVVLVGSVAGIIASPGQGAYHASKYAVRAIGQVLSMELAGSGVTCTTVHPGFVESEIAQVDNDGQFREDWVDKRPQKLMWSSQRAAKTIAGAVYHRKREFTFTGHGKAVGFLGQHAPSFVHFATTKFMKAPYKRRDEEAP